MVVVGKRNHMMHKEIERGRWWW